MSDQKSAFITGANMGMGALKARTLAERGWKVFAGVYPGAPTDELGTHDNITAIKQDVTSVKSVEASAKKVQKALGDAGLDLLINNAGIANVGIGVIEGADIDRGKIMFEVNTWGPMRVLQSFLPMIRKNAPHSRIINFASGAVRANPAASGVYNMSKHAVIGLTNTLRNELAPFGIQVTSVEPGAVKTHMTANAADTTQNIWKEVSQEMNDVYGPYLKETTTTLMTEMLENNCNEPQDVVNEVLALLDKKNWKPSYLVGKDARAMGPMQKILPARTFEKILQKAVKIPRYKG
ncbi:MAG: SDR family NAD(P)-dependent oxidoreductase [Hellea sp.]|nr:SDR family NAD(P)-dependent oxidoreductase [Hellea sp.]